MLKNPFPYINATAKRNRLKFCLRLSSKTSKQLKEKVTTKPPSDVVNYLESSQDYKDIINKIPKALLRKYKAPESMYLVNKKTAKEIADTIRNHIKKASPIVEVNPGFGFLSHELLECQKEHIYMYETSSHFEPYISILQNKYPGRITFKEADFFGMWKLAFQDKMDQGNRIEELLGGLCTDDHDRIVTIIGSMPGLSFVKHLINNIIFHNTTNQLGRPDLFITMPDRIVTIIGSMPGLSFVKHLINNIIFHNTTNQLGRPDLFITMPGHHYEFLTDNAIQVNKHKTVPALFQMLFDYKVLTSVPKVHFLPWTYASNSKKVTLMDEHRLYLVNITQKETLPCPSEYLPLLWYFFKPQMFSKSTRVIPMLEQWIPGCGVWLITGQEPPDTNKKLAPGKDDAELPHMTIFTEFGDLNLRQKITVFKKFISWPEFEQCQFRLTMENNLPKFVTQLDDDDKETIGTHIEDDTEHSDVEHDHEFVK